MLKPIAFQCFVKVFFFLTSLFFSKKPTFRDYFSVPFSGSRGNPREDDIITPAEAFNRIYSTFTSDPLHECGHCNYNQANSLSPQLHGKDHQTQQFILSPQLQPDLSA